VGSWAQQPLGPGETNPPNFWVGGPAMYLSPSTFLSNAASHRCIRLKTYLRNSMSQHSACHSITWLFPAGAERSYNVHWRVAAELKGERLTCDATFASVNKTSAGSRASRAWASQTFVGRSRAHAGRNYRRPIAHARDASLTSSQWRIQKFSKGGRRIY